MTNIKHALNRLQTALKYGPDMESSQALCVQDALSLLRDSEQTVGVKGAIAALTQNKTFPADIRYAVFCLDESITDYRTVRAL